MLFRSRLENFKKNPPDISGKFLEPEEALKVIALLPDDDKLPAKFMLLTGVRFGEMSALDLSDIGESIRIYKTIDSTTKEITAPKTALSIRDIHITPELFDLLQEIYAQRERRVLLTGSTSPALFLNRKGNRLSIHTFNLHFRRASTAVLGRALSSHALRHSYASIRSGRAHV